MKKELAQALGSAVQKAAVALSGERAGNVNHETFNVHQVVPLSELTAAVIFKKDSGKYALAFFYYFKDQASGPRWINFTPAESHLFGMQNPRLRQLLTDVEARNYPVNFD